MAAYALKKTRVTRLVSCCARARASTAIFWRARVYRHLLARVCRQVQTNVDAQMRARATSKPRAQLTFASRVHLPSDGAAQ